MPKLKSNRGAAKRFKATGGGKIRRYKAYASHLLTGKTTKQKRRLRKSTWWIRRTKSISNIYCPILDERCTRGSPWTGWKKDGSL